jgi:tyrosyl-tRNA synthetase
MQPDEALDLLTRGAAQIISKTELREKLALGRPLRVKLGVDPTSPDLHLGHTLALRKLREFQDLGHQAVLILGDFTAMIGDPSGRSATRPQLSRDQVAANAETYREQAFKILDPARTRIIYNGEWFAQMQFEEIIRLNSFVTLQQMLQREDFRQRLDQQQPIHAHEIQYPIMQGWDSVMVQADVELGGTDQLFNLNVGRDIMPAYGLEPQVVMTTPLLEGLDGVEKMSKSLGNYVGVTDAPVEMFGKLMSISDELMWRYYALLTDFDRSTVDARQAAVSRGELHPKQAKVDLATAIVGEFHGTEAARGAAEQFERRFTRKELNADELPEVLWPLPDEPRPWRQLLTGLKLAKSGGEADQKLRQGAVRLDGVKVSGPFAIQQELLVRGGRYLLEVGRRAYRLVVQ